MAMPATPDWLKLRDGTVSSGLTAATVVVQLNGQPHYRLDARPAGGTFVCGITQTVNGKRLDDTAKYPHPDAALVAGLETLRICLGW